MSDSLRPHELYNPWDSPGQNAGLGSLSLLQGIFPTQGSNPGLWHCRQILYQLSHKGSPMLRIFYHNFLKLKKFHFKKIERGSIPEEDHGPLNTPRYWSQNTRKEAASPPHPPKVETHVHTPAYHTPIPMSLVLGTKEGKALDRLWDCNFKQMALS